MWGQIFLESSIQQNFNFGFSTYKSDILLHLSQWQYWWWFWFSLVWVSYYYIIIYCITKRTFLFNPVINTSLRGHGKWGDFLVAIIPLSWCGNILVNSNFILRMIEWQNESSLFTLRIQGKQWYWVYKFDATTATSVLSSPKNLGKNRWLIWGVNDVYTSDSYYQAIHLTSQIEFQDSYYTLLDKSLNNKFNLESNSLNLNKIFVNNIDFKDFTIYKNYNVLNIHKLEDFNFNLVLNKLNIFKLNYFNFKKYSLIYKKFFDLNIGDLNFTYFKLNILPRLTVSSHYDFLKIDDSSDTMGNLKLNYANFPLRLIKSPLNLQLLDNFSSNNISKLPFFHLKYYDSSNSISIKPYQNEMFWGFRQKKYKRLKKFIFTNTLVFDPINYNIIESNKNLVTQRYFKNLQILGLKDTQYTIKNINNINILNFLNKNENSSINLKSTFSDIKKNNFNYTTSAFDYYKAIKASKNRTEMLSVTLARRLLRVKRTLVLPAHINITVITNSYDVVHSWFIPGLGIKLDCVPGRSTHHTFYIDNIGFYYGQCAEICGRYHHHMPIRICAVSFEQFLIWWYKRGLPRLNRLNIQGQSLEKTDKYYNYISITDNKIKKNLNNLDFSVYKYDW